MVPLDAFDLTDQVDSISVRGAAWDAGTMAAVAHTLPHNPQIKSLRCVLPHRKGISTTSCLAST